MMRKYVIGLALMAVSAVVCAAPLPEPWTRLVKSFDATLADDHVVGGSVALVEKGRIVASHYYGFADKAKGRRVDADTIYHWASITKTLNAITVMQLRDRGMLSLDQPITRYVPELRRVHNPFGSMDAITLRMLLNHSSGFQHSTWPYGDGSAWQPFEPTDWQQLVAMMPYQQLEFAPGSKFLYSNPTWIYLARTLEQLSGDPWRYYVQKNIFMPLGMTRSYFGHTPPHLSAQRSSRFVVRKAADGSLVTDDLGGEFDPGITIPNGGWNAPFADAAAYVAFLTGASSGDADIKRRYDAVLKRSTLEEMWQPQYPAGVRETGENIGLAFFLADQGGHRVIGHTGNQGGFLSFIYCDPGTGRGIVAALNTNNEARSDGVPSAISIVRREAMKVFD
jgi:CubicO group peptidase (beta-lactamase class C family)